MKNIDWNKVRAWIGERSKFIVLVVIFVFVLLLLLPSRHSSPSPSPHRGSSNPQISGSLSIVPKSSPSDSDLIVEHHYKATIDGEVVNVPIHVVSPISSSSPDSGSSDVVDNGYTATYKQELDLTPLLSDYEHKTNWEVGVGVGSHDGDVYFPVSIQRNLSHDRAVEGVVHVSDSGSVTGGEVLYKHRF